MRYTSGLFVTLFVYLLTTQSSVNGYPNKKTSLPETDTLSDGSQREELAKNLPKMKSTPSTKAANEGDTVTFPCEVEDLGSLSVAWNKRKASKSASIFLGAFRLLNDDRIYLEKNNLVIKNVNESDSGTYTCKVSTDKDISVEHILLVHSVPTIKVEPADKVVVLTKGQTLRLKCKSSAEQKPDIKWEKDNNKLTTASNNQDTLEIPNVSRGDAGKYKCVAYSFYGSVSQAEFDVAVEEGPEIELPEPNVYTGIGQQVKLRCKVHGTPKPSVTWENSKNGRLPGEFDTQEYFALVNIREESDFGKYRCSASNRFDKAVGEIEVSGRPSKPIILNSDDDFPSSGEEFELKYQVTSYSPITKIIVSYRYSKNLDKFSDWNTTEVNAGDSIGPTYNLKHVLSNMERNTYEVKVYAENKYGRSEGSDIHSITTDGEKEHWKAAGSNSYGTKSSISLITCMVILITFCLSS
ncbi:protein amalgam [Tetranychus urticae]|uniref:Ig-like domain-containing protein n=1 Tax=Tetranychus urticae TaxID=32264 RepID=T1L4G0_TETUR|nr:protein amalgam [Tetranychus urticae]